MDIFHNLITVRYKDDELLNELKMFKLNNDDLFLKLNKKIDNIQYIQNLIVVMIVGIAINKIMLNLW
jgi:hypothetical protein